jgi:hypothetical protein
MNFEKIRHEQETSSAKTNKVSKQPEKGVSRESKEFSLGVERVWQNAIAGVKLKIMRLDAEDDVKKGILKEAEKLFKDENFKRQATGAWEKTLSSAAYEKIDGVEENLKNGLYQRVMGKLSKSA